MREDTDLSLNALLSDEGLQSSSFGVLRVAKVQNFCVNKQNGTR